MAISTEKTPEATTIVPSAPAYVYSLLGLLARSIAQGPLPLILEPRPFREFSPSSALPECSQSALPTSLETAVRLPCQLVSIGYPL